MLFLLCFGGVVLGVLGVFYISHKHTSHQKKKKKIKNKTAEIVSDLQKYILTVTSSYLQVLCQCCGQWS